MTMTIVGGFLGAALGAVAAPALVFAAVPIASFGAVAFGVGTVGGAIGGAIGGTKINEQLKSKHNLNFSDINYTSFHLGLDSDKYINGDILDENERR